jgi:putative Mg2+ transporter-C (MgtC) family protein
MTETDILIRLLVSAGAGMLLGFDRELRGISAGIRTHAVVSLSSAVITVSALLLYDELRANGSQDIDPLRVIQGLAQAIGFIAAGAIFVAKGDVHNLTSAANIWLAAAVGIAAGAGQYTLLGMALVLGIVIITGVRVVERLIPGSDKARRE